MKKSEEIKELAKKLESGKSSEEKKIEQLMKSTDSEAVKQALQSRIEELHVPAMGIDEVRAEIEEQGYTIEHILRLGLSKLGNQLAWQEKQAEKEE